jgi:hypothetical protein
LAFRDPGRLSSVVWKKWYEIDPETHAKTYYIEEDVVSYGGSGISISWVPAGHARPSQVLMSYTR